MGKRWRGVPEAQVCQTQIHCGYATVPESKQVFTIMEIGQGRDAR